MAEFFTPVTNNGLLQITLLSSSMKQVTLYERTLELCYVPIARVFKYTHKFRELVIVLNVNLI